MLSAFRTHLVARRRSPNTIRLRMVYLNLLAREHDLALVTATDLETVLASRPDWSPETVNSAISSWRTFYKWAIRTGHLSTDPTIDLEMLYVPRVVKTLADDERVRAALETASPRDRAIVLLGREAGLRRAEIAALHKSNRRGGWLHITGKGSRFRRVPMSARLTAALDAIDTDGYYFPGRYTGHLAANTVARIVGRLIGTSPHSLRRSALTSVYRKSGGDLRMTQEFAGHSSPNVTAIYVQVDDDDLIKASGFASLGY